MTDLQIKLAQWLAEEHPWSVSVEMIQKANIYHKGDLVHIVYDNGVVDDVKITNGVVHEYELT